MGASLFNKGEKMDDINVIKYQFETIASALKVCRIDVPCEMYVPRDVFEALEGSYRMMQKYPNSGKGAELDAIEIMGVLRVRKDAYLNDMKKQEQNSREAFNDLLHEVVGVFEDFKFRGRI